MDSNFIIENFFELNKGEVMKLIEAGNINIKDTNIGATPLIYACNIENLELVTLLLNMGVNVTDTDNDGVTALHEACSMNNINIVNLLLKNGANINQKDNDGNTPFETACMYGYKKIVKTLLDKGANYELDEEGYICYDMNKTYNDDDGIKIRRFLNTYSESMCNVKPALNR